MIDYKNDQRNDSIYSIVESVIVGCIVWLSMSVVLVLTLAIVCLPFLLFGLYSKAFFAGFSTVEIFFTLCMIYAIIYSVMNTERRKDESE